MPPPGSISTVTCTIGAGQSLSSAADCSFGTPVFLETPADWNFAGGLSFQVSPDGTAFFDLFDTNGSEVTMGVIEGVGIALPGALAWAAAIKIRSGSRLNPVPQDAARVFSVILQQ